MRAAFFSLLVTLCLASGNLPVPTVSGVCPAIDFGQQWASGPGRFELQFQPQNPYQTFDFVDVHIALETASGELVGPVRNYHMQQTGLGRWTAALKDPKHISAMEHKRGNSVLRYSFTYCTAGQSGKPVDCDTEVFAVERFEWRVGEFPACPSECGLDSSQVSRSLQCVLDGTVLPRPEMSCQGLQRPTTVRQCPPTKSCVTYAWQAEQVICPTECGNPASSVRPGAICVGTDGQTYANQHCAHLQYPSDQHCPATESCVTHMWQAEQVICPTECGLPASSVRPEAVCVGSDDQTYANQHCAHLQYPSDQHCPATESCVTYMWQAEQVICPTECGLPASSVRPETFCVGSDGQSYLDQHCAHLQYPSDQHCPATEACVTYMWRGGLVECPSECGLQASVIQPRSDCVTNLGEVVPASFCNALQLPAPIHCMATGPCAVSPYCHPIRFKNRVDRGADGSLNLVFTPLDKQGGDIRKYNIEWVDVHISVTDLNGYVVNGGMKQNYRMQKPSKTALLLPYEWTHTVTFGPHLAALRLPGRQMIYSFTYCINMVDCDTQDYYFTL